MVYVAKLGIGLLPPRHDEVSGFGHMWLYWKTPEKEHHPPFRGYYPVVEEIPSEYRDYSKWPRFFARQRVQGRYQVDFDAMDIIHKLSDRVLVKEWPITKEQLIRLRNRCFIPEGEQDVLEGYYSWNKGRSDWHNCSSWVISVVNHVMDEPNFLACASPKRLGVVGIEIWKNREED